MTHRVPDASQSRRRDVQSYPITARGCLEARKLLGWDRIDLQVTSGLGEPTIRALESGATVSDFSRAKVVLALRDAGVAIRNDGEAAWVVGPLQTAPSARSPWSYPNRLTTAEVCALARYGPATLWRRVKQGRMPKPVDRGRHSLFDRDEVLAALGFNREPSAYHPGPPDPWEFDPVAYAAAREQAREAKRRARKFARKRGPTEL